MERLKGKLFLDSNDKDLIFCVDKSGVGTSISYYYSRWDWTLSDYDEDSFGNITILGPSCLARW